MSARRRNLTEAVQASPSAGPRNLVLEGIILTRVKGLLTQLAPWNFEDIKHQLIESLDGTISPFVLKALVSIIFKTAVTGEAIISFARLCSELQYHLPSFPSDEADKKDITFKRILLNSCQEEYENGYQKVKNMPMADDEDKLKHRFFGTLQFLAELVKHRMVPQFIIHHIIQQLLEPTSPPEIYIESTCQLLNSMRKEMDAGPKSRRVFDLYCEKLKDLNSELTPRLRFMVQNLIALRANHWGQDKTIMTTEFLSREGETPEARFHSNTTSSESCEKLEGTEQKPEPSGPSLAEEEDYLPASERVKTMINSEFQLEEDENKELYSCEMARTSKAEVMDKNISEELEKALAELNVLKQEARREHLLRIAAENDVIQAIHKAEVLESKYKNELKHRQETEEALAQKKEELQKMKHLLDVYEKD